MRSANTGSRAPDRRRAWERRGDFLVLNPAGTAPVLVDEGQPPVPGAAIVAEYLDEVRGEGSATSACCARDGPRVGAAAHELVQ